MPTHQGYTFYMFRVVPVPARIAEAALDRVLSDIAARSPVAGRRALPLREARLEIEGIERLEPRSFSWPSRRVRAVLRRPWLPGIPVEIELLAWSDDAAQIGIRPAWRRWPSGRSTGAYFRAGSEALDVVSREVSAWADAGLPAAGAEVGPDAGAAA